jgi:hypothetical protein
MKAFPVVILVLLAFAAFFLTFLVAPLAVLLVFYAVFASGIGRGEKAAPAATPAEAQPRWETGHVDAAPDAEQEPAPTPARRARIRVVSRSDEQAAERAAQLEAAAATDEAGAQGAPVTQPTGTTAPATSSPT